MKLLYKADRLLGKVTFDDYGNIRATLKNICLAMWMCDVLLLGIAFGKYVELPPSVIVDILAAMGFLLAMFVVGFAVPFTVLQRIEDPAKDEYFRLQQKRIRQREREQQQEIRRRMPVTRDD